MNNFLDGLVSVDDFDIANNLDFEQRPFDGHLRQDLPPDQPLDHALVSDFELFDPSLLDPPLLGPSLLDSGRAYHQYLPNPPSAPDRIIQQMQPHDNGPSPPPKQTHDQFLWTPEHNYRHQSENISSSDHTTSVLAQTTADVGTQDPANVATRSSSSDSGEASSDSAAVVEPRVKITMPPPGSDGLRFSSRAVASETFDLFSRERFEVKNDDFAEVEQKGRQHVKSLVNALKYEGFLAAPDSRTAASNKMKALDADEKQAWDDWQNGACINVKAHMAQPEAEAKVELRAWEIFDEIVKVHSAGSQHTTLTRDCKSTCSERILHALQAIKDHAIVRQKIMDGDKISVFAASPEDYARVTRRSHYNNSGRKKKAEILARGQAGATAGQSSVGNTTSQQTGSTGGQSGAGTAQGRRTATSTGAIARRSMPRKQLKLIKKRAVKAIVSKSDATTGDAGALLTTVTTTSTLSEPLYVPAAVEEEGDSFSDEYFGLDRSSDQASSWASSDNPRLFRSGRAPLQGHGIRHPPPSGIRESYVPVNWNLGPTMHLSSLGEINDRISNVDNGAGLSVSGTRSGLENSDLLASTQNQFRRGAARFERSSQRTATTLDVSDAGNFSPDGQMLSNTTNQLRSGAVPSRTSQPATITHGVYGAGDFLQDDQALQNTQNQIHGGAVQHASAAYGVYGAVPNFRSTERYQTYGGASDDDTRKRRRIE